MTKVKKPCPKCLHKTRRRKQPLPGGQVAVYCVDCNTLLKIV